MIITFLLTRKFPAFVYVTPETTPFYTGGNRARKGSVPGPPSAVKGAEFRFELRSSRVALVIKTPPANAGDAREAGSALRSGRPPGEGNRNPLQYSCLENATDGGAWRAAVHRVTKNRTRRSVQAHTRARMHARTHTHTYTHMCARARDS